MARLTWMAAAVWVVGSASAAHAARPTCAELARVPSWGDGERIAWADAIWEAVGSTELRLGGDVALPAIRWIGSGRAGAWYCRSADRVYVSSALVDYAWRGREVDGAGLLAFVLAHELAHRRFDDDDGAEPAAASCGALPGPELRADERAAFMLALTRDPHGPRALSPFQLERRGTLSSFLADELGWSDECAALERRLAMLRDSVARMHELGRIYETAIALAFVDRSVGEVPALLSALDAAVNDPRRPWASVPELKLTRALVHLARAASSSCPDHLARAPLIPPACVLRCQAIVPTHALLAPYDPYGARAPVASGADELALAARLLDEGRRLGARPLQTLGIEACLAFAAGDLGAVQDAATELAAAIPPAFRTPMRAAIRDLRQAAVLESFLREETEPVGGDSWIDALRALRADHALTEESHAGRLVARWLGEPPPPSAPPAGAPLEAPRLDAWVRAVACGRFAGHELADGWRVETTPSCARVHRAGRLVASLHELTPTALSEDVEPWSRHCRLEERGWDDAGEGIVWASCPAWDGPDSGFVLFARGARVARAIRLVW